VIKEEIDGAVLLALTDNEILQLFNKVNLNDFRLKLKRLCIIWNSFSPHHASAYIQDLNQSSSLVQSFALAEEEEPEPVFKFLVPYKEL
jgi:hypothetical protein